MTQNKSNNEAREGAEVVNILTFKNKDFVNLKKKIIAFFSGENRSKAVVIIGFCGIGLIFLSGFFKTDSKKSVKKAESQMSSDQHKENLEQSLENIISGIRGAGNAKVLVTLESGAQTVYAAEERKNKEASEDKASGEVTRKKESDDCEKKYITIKDSEGAEHALAVTEIQPKAKGVVVVCPGGDDVLVQKRVTEAVTTALNITSRHVCVTKSA